MNISMSTKAHYVIQSSAYDRLLVGRILTDRIIAKRKKQGYFGNGIVHQEHTKKRKTKNVIKDLLKDFAL